MTCPESIKFTLRHFWETAYTLVSPVGAKPVAPPCKYLVTIGLMTYIPDKLVVWSVKNVMKRNCKLYNTQTGSEVTRVFAYHVNYILPQFPAKPD